MPSNYTSLTVTWHDASDSYSTNVNVTSDVKSLPMFTDTGTGEVNQARIILRALDGKYINSGNKIDIFDRFHIECTDLGGNSYDRFFEVIDIIPSVTKREGTLLTLDCLGIEYHTQQVHMSKPFYFANANFVVKDIADMYSENKGSLQPSVANANTFWNGTIGNGAPKWTANNYEYGLNEESCYNRWMDVLEKLGASVSNGGALTFFELSFVANNVNSIKLRFRDSGDNTPTVTIKNAKVTRPITVGDQEGMLSNPTGTNILAWGSPNHGTLPVEYSKYDSQLMFFNFRPEWLTGVPYTENAKVKVTDSNQIARHYKATSSHTGVNSGTFATDLSAGKWTPIDMSEEFGDSVQYSAWTDDKSALWRNAMANPTGSQFAWDINLIVWDEGYFRTWVDARATTNSHLTDLIDNGGDNEGYAFDFTDVTTLPRGFRVLVDIPGKGASSGALNNFDNMVVEWDGSAWNRKYKFTSDNDRVQIAVIDEAKVYEGNSFATTPTWTAIDGSAFGNECFHPGVSVTEVQGVDLINGTPRSEITDSTNRPDISRDGAQFAKNINSALKFTYTWSDILSSSFSSQTGEWYKRGAWANFRFPYPVNDYRGISETVGALYKPDTMDIQNMHLLSDGTRGFNQANQSEDLGAINAISWWQKFEVISGIDVDADDPFRVFMIDTADNVVYADYNQQFRDNWEEIRIPISAFRIYRGRKPAYGIENILQLIPPKELEVINIFEWRNIKFIGIQWLQPYDEFGRYNPTKTAFANGDIATLFSALAGGSVAISIDGFRFIKPLLVSTGGDTTRNLEPNFLQRPNITLYDQLTNDAKSQLEIEKFRAKIFNIETSGDNIFDIPFGDSFLLENDKIVQVDNPKATESTNKIELVNKRAEYSITKPQTGLGGLRRRINGSKVFT